jgi:Superfamily I DNA and RNA helicases
MNTKELELEKAKLQEIILKLKKEEDSLNSRLKESSKAYDKEDFVRAHLIHLATERIKNINLIKEKPYFARFDFTENGGNVEEFYIGKLSVMDDNNNKPLIVDWRAPISNLYYEGRIGKASYNCLEGEIEGTISLKRQFFIENKKLQRYIDIDVTTNDQLLQDSLSKNADDRLKNIVATIQEEQNRIIRADMNIPLIVQGVAGSGKTTIALHRIAYLIYNYEKEFKPEQFMIIAPNKFFLNYISNVLPDLGVEDVKQYTFEEFAYEVMKKRLKISDNNEKLVMIVNGQFDDINKGNTSLMVAESKYKASIKFKNIVDGYLKQIEQNYISKDDFVVENECVMKNRDIQKLFLYTYKGYCFKRRIQEVKKHMVSKLKEESPYIINKIVENRTKEIKSLHNLEITEEELKKRRIKIFEDKEIILKNLETCHNKLVDEFFKTLSTKDALAYYKDFLSSYIIELEGDKQLFEYLSENTLKNINNKEIAFEDLAPLMYMHYRIYGVSYKNDLRHIVIDEAQDYGEFQFWVLKTILNSNSMTILGDIAQGVHYYRGIENWKDFIDIEFEDVKTEYATLSKTYRTTKEIMDIANGVISKLDFHEREFIILGDPVVLNKNSVNINKVNSFKDMVYDFNNKINNYLKQEYKSIVIIAKTRDECSKIAKDMKKYRSDVILIESKDSMYNAGISIIPSYLAKGLEFDVVMLANVDNSNYTKSSLDIKLLYVAITRAMSKLEIYYENELSELI